ncbi:MAG: hypothetical protein KUL86_12500 [Castellaniella sp.]|nr:hypothetical protein [Castellaniella sp.]
MTDIEICAQMTLIKALMENVYGNAFKGDPEAFEVFMGDLSKRLRFGLRAPAHAIADDAEWLQAMQAQTLKDADAFRDRVLSAIRPGGAGA